MSFGQEEVEEKGESKVWVISLSNPSPITLEAIADSLCKNDENLEACKSEKITELLNEIEELRNSSSTNTDTSAVESPSVTDDPVETPPQSPLSKREVFGGEVVDTLVIEDSVETLLPPLSVKTFVHHDN